MSNKLNYYKNLKKVYLNKLKYTDEYYDIKNNLENSFKLISIFKFSYPYKIKIYNLDKDISIISKLLNNTKKFEYPKLDILYNLIRINLKIRDHIVKNNKIFYKTNLLVDTARKGMAKYLTSENNKKISNGFVKLYEIIKTFNLIPKGENINAFHLAEAPGQFINCIKHYIETKRKNIKYNWYANALNPNNKEVKKIFGDVFNDAYNFMKNNPKKWIWGEDDTGDITRINNIKYFKNFIKKQNFDCNLVTGDIGTNKETNLINLVKLEYYQIVNAINLCSIDTNIVLKSFLPLVGNNIESIKLNSVYISYYYLLYLLFDKLYFFKPSSSKQSSAEIYIIGINFIGIKQSLLDKLINSKLNINIPIFAKEDISPTFLKSMENLFVDIYKLNDKNVQQQNIIYNCMTNKDHKLNKEIGCDFINNTKIVNELILEKKKEWIEHFNFV